MIFFCTNRTIYIQPLFGGTYDTVHFHLIFGLECFLILLSFLISWYFMYLIMTIKICHLNMTFLIGSFGLLIMESSVAHGLLMVDVWNGKVASCSWRIEVASIFLIFYCSFIVHISVAALVERFSALLCLEDYEKKSRLHLPLILLSLTFCVASLFTYLTSQKYITTSLNFIYLSSVVLTSSPAYFLIWKYNSVLLRRIEKCSKPEEYSLSKRFQLIENIRVFRLTRNTILAMVLAGAAILLMVTLTGADMKADEKYLPSQLAISQIFIVGVSILSSERWKTFTLRCLPATRWKIVHSAGPVEPSVSRQGDLYFKQLENAWSTQ